MAAKSASILLVRTSFLSTCPQVFRDHVAKYFAPVTMFGVECMYAFQDSNGHNAHCAGGRIVIGVTPSHHEYLRAKVGENMDLMAWIDKVLEEKGQQNIVELSKEWDDGSIAFPES